MTGMRGYFGIGVEGISKPYNVGNLFRTAHAFGASFVYTVNARYTRSEGKKIDTSDATGQMPFYSFPTMEDMLLPRGCQLVGIELTDDAIEMPSFRHPAQAAYILGAERIGLSAQMIDRCDYIIKIPTRFSLNVGIAGALVMYDRMLSYGKFAERPVRSGGPTDGKPEHRHGKPIFRGENPMAYLEPLENFRDEPPLAEVELSRTGSGKRQTAKKLK